MGAVRVAIDVGALQGPRTGIGNAVAWLRDALVAEGSVDVYEYVTSMRAKIEPPIRRLPIPAAIAHRWWQHAAPPLDRFLGRPDVVHGTNYVVPPTRAPRLVSVYDCWFLDNPDDAHPDVRRAGRVLQRAVDEGATVVACSEATAIRVRETLGTERVRTILLGPPSTTPAAAVPDGRIGPGGPFVLSLGTIERRKNIPTLVAAFARVAHEHEDARLVIAGADGDDGAAVDAAIARLNTDAAARVARVGAVDGATKRWLLENARTLAYPSLDEGFGFPVLEAQQAGLPVVTSTVGSIPEIAGNAALFSQPDDVDALAANLHWVLTNDAIHTKLVRQGTRNVSRFSWADTARRHAALYTELATGVPA